MSNENIFAPMAPMPPEISKALFGTPSTPTDNEESEEAHELFQRTTAIPNPWAPRADGDGRVNFIAEDEEEKLLRQPLEALDKLFMPAAPVRITPRLGDLRVRPEEDFDEKAFACPIKKLFFADIKSITPEPTQNFHKTDKPWEAPLESEIEALLDSGDQHRLEKRLKDSSGRAALTAWIRKCIADGDTVEGLMEYAEAHDPAKAELIRSIGSEL